MVFPKDSKIRVQNFHIFALSLVMNELLKVRDIQARLGIGRSAVYALIHEPTFPAPIAINSRNLRWEVTEQRGLQEKYYESTAGV